MKEIVIHTAAPYPVYIGQNLWYTAGAAIRACLPAARRAVIVADYTVSQINMFGTFEQVMPLPQLRHALHTAGLETMDFIIASGEDAKTGAAYLELLEYLAAREIGREDVIIALGGGTIGDLAGFAAATYLRGIAYIQVPTTLLAMVDAAIGGKTGINLAAGKNLAGAFHQPSLVLCDTECLKTLPPEVFADGAAEVIKYGMLGDLRLLETLSQTPLQTVDAETLEAIIAACVAAKGRYIEADEFDCGERQLLNFGHSFGHAIEHLSGYEISHGKAVSIGMALATRAAVSQKLCPPSCLDRLEALLQSHKLPTQSDICAEALCTALLRDKKRRNEAINFVIPEEWGRCRLHKIGLEDLPAWAEGGRDYEG